MNKRIITTFLGAIALVCMCALTACSNSSGGNDPVVNTADKASLIAAITSATEKNTATVVGTGTGNVSQTAKDAFTAAIAAAQVVADNTDATQAEVDSANTTLAAALVAFNAAIISTGGSTTIDKLYADSSYTFGFWDQITGGETPDFAIGDYNTTTALELVGTNDSVKVTIGTGAASAGWSAGTLAQVSDPAKLKGSYFDFTNVASIKFKVRGTMALSGIKFKVEALDASIPIAEVAISTYGVSSLNATDWSEAVVPVSSFTNKQIKGAFIFVLDKSDTGWVEFKNIAFVDASGANVDIAEHITY